MTSAESGFCSSCLPSFGAILPGRWLHMASHAGFMSQTGRHLLDLFHRLPVEDSDPSKWKAAKYVDQCLEKPKSSPTHSHWS